MYLHRFYTVFAKFLILSKGIKGIIFFHIKSSVVIRNSTRIFKYILFTNRFRVVLRIKFGSLIKLRIFGCWQKVLEITEKDYKANLIDHNENKQT